MSINLVLDDDLRDQLVAWNRWGAVAGGPQSSSSSRDSVVELCRHASALKTQHAHDSQRSSVQTVKYVGRDEGIHEFSSNIHHTSTQNHDAGNSEDRPDPRISTVASDPTLTLQDPAKLSPPLLASASPQSATTITFCRISRFPCAHPCDVPDLVCESDTTLSISTCSEDPGTPNLDDLFLPLTQLSLPDLHLGAFEPISMVPAGDEDIDDGASMTPTEISFAESSEGVRLPTAESAPQSIKSLENGSQTSGPVKLFRLRTSAQKSSEMPLPLPSEPNRISKLLRMPWVPDDKAPTVFGVDLKESVRLAPMKIRILHKGRSTSYRTYPICVYKCCEFIRANAHRDVFLSPGDPANIAALKALFNQAPSYGLHFRFEDYDYTVHDAARLVLLFLEELPKPLIPASVFKSWILLGKQYGAIEPSCPRVETGLDFWTEALNRLSTPARNLTKLLLTLFAEVLLDAHGTIHEAHARQLASAVSRALFHQEMHTAEETRIKGRRRHTTSTKRNVQPTLALAFLIQKRGEYVSSLRGLTSGKGDSELFLPSTKEIMEWRGKSEK